MKILIQLALFIIPWPLRRRLLIILFKYKISPSAKIGISVVAPEILVMEDNSRIGNFNFITKLRLLEIGDFGRIGSLNRVTAMPKSNTQFFRNDPDRDPVLKIGRHAAVTNAHQIDCTDSVTIGDFSTFAGWHSQILTHAIDFEEPRQKAQPVTIGSYSFVGTRSVFLPGASLPSYSILAAGAVVHRPMPDTHTLYGGTPAVAIKAVDPQLGYFARATGFIS